MNPAFLIWQAEHWNDGRQTAVRGLSQAELAIAISLRPRRQHARTASAVKAAGRAFRGALAVFSGHHAPRPVPSADSGIEVC